LKKLKKSAIYAFIIALLAAAAFVVNEVRMTRDVMENPKLFVGGVNAGTASPPAENAEKFLIPRDVPTGSSSRLSASELAWLLRERIILDVLQDFADRGGPLDSYNDRVRAYNELAGVVEYKEGDMRTAELRVEEIKERVVEDAMDEALERSMPPDIRSGGGSAVIWTAQKLLSAEGFYLGEPDGREGGPTAHAARMFQTASGADPGGAIDSALVSRLRAAYIRRRTPASVGF
jgi:hypothetical protein